LESQTKDGSEESENGYFVGTGIYSVKMQLQSKPVTVFSDLWQNNQDLLMCNPKN
jgi:hypothetical protein